VSARIHRYRLPITDRAVVSMPAGAALLSIGPPRDHHAALDVWALVDPNAELRPRAFHVIGTGNPMPAALGPYLGSVTTHAGALVFHVFAEDDE
jgi:hypothetical protein